MKPQVIGARALLGFALLLFVSGYLLAGLNTVKATPDWGDQMSELFFPTIPMAFAVVGSIIASRHPGTPIGWLALAVGIGGLGPLFPNGYATYTTSTNPGALPFGAFSAWVEEWSWVVWVGPAGIFILLFPDGRLASHRWRPVLWLAVMAMILAISAIAFRPGPLEFNPQVRNPFGLPIAEPIFKTLAAGIVLIPISILLAAFSLLTRYRRAQGDTRLQLKWFTAAVVLVAILHFISSGATFLHAALSGKGLFTSSDPPAIMILQGIGISSWILVPIAAGIAILKFRLYSINLVLNKALIFGTLAGFVTAAYVAIVVGIGARLGSGSEPNLFLSIIATAVVAVAFQPIKQRVQRLANRVVYGRRSTPYQVLAGLAGEIGKGYSAGEISLRVAQALFEGTGAARTELWLLVEDRLTMSARYPSEADPKSQEEVDTCVDIEYEGEHLGVLALHKRPGEVASEVDKELMRNLSSQVALVLRNARLTEELKLRLAEISRQAEELRASRQRIVNAQDAERQRIERNLHDGAQQRLLTLSLSLRRAEAKLGESDGEIKQILAKSAEELKSALSELRELARGIHPAILREEGLGAAVQSLGERAPLPVSVNDGQVGRLPGTVEATAYFVVAEALTNIARYSNASRADVSICVDDGWLSLKVADDGAGGADPVNGTGLRGLMDRVSALGGELEVRSAPGEGTVVGARIPCA